MVIFTTIMVMPVITMISSMMITTTTGNIMVPIIVGPSVASKHEQGFHRGLRPSAVKAKTSGKRDRVVAALRPAPLAFSDL